MKARGFVRIIIILALLAVVIGLDQVSKIMVRHNVMYYQYTHYFNDRFTLTRVENTGAFLSVGNTLAGPVRFIVLNLLPLLAVIAGLIFMLTRQLNRTTLASIILIVGGGFGNIYDRIRYGSVTDFMHINFGFFQTGIFNVADVTILAGMLMLLFYAFFKRTDEEEIEESPAEEPLV
ncbi:signal peptidase II [Mucilaginibacter sp. L3T2-6]|uniref:signal peptidase II n=1 Tax=Mucilaginibacter sp. L3T2-6 TaxID=3062491 RepID=UPI0026758C55|nr:signal peptidase II [Mucilaginibacter sp. L3T2-6]MDO3640712.1 signal peptidase II [Mucilaginibacter sp. L3T2-6]MDV6212947.1 signal peptidase II [Mucilaginibacter sp. L3T2-6]